MFKEREKEDEEAIEGETVVPGETNTEVALAGKKSIETVKGVDNCCHLNIMIINSIYR